MTRQLIPRSLKPQHEGWKLILPSVLVALALIAAACGSDDDESTPAPETTATASPTLGTHGDPPEGTGGTDSDTEGTDSDAEGTDSEGTGGSEPEETAPPTTEPPAPEPVYGGTLVVGLEAETVSGWNPATQTCAVACHYVMSTIFDPLFVVDADGNMKPYLLESATPNDDFSQWTFTLRPNLMFHDGTPADSAALKRHIMESFTGLLTGIIMRPLLGNPEESIEILDERSILINLTGPVSGFPSIFSAQIGYFAAPSQYDLGPDSARKPIGTGPFVFEDWVTDDQLVVTKNESYWRTDQQGNSLPYLDRIVFRPIPDSDARRTVFRSGALHVNNDGSALNYPDFRDSDDFGVLVEEEKLRETVYVLINNDRAPFNDVRARRAVIMCTNTELYIQLRTGNNALVSNGPFSPGTPGYLNDTGYPSYDPDAGEALWNELEDPGTISLSTTNDPFNRTSTELLADSWGNCGIDVKIDQVDQSQLISNAVAGNFQLMLWRQHNGQHVEGERVWWHSDNAEGLAVNFGRIRNDTMDNLMDEARQTDDPDKLREIAEDINRQFGEQAHNIWLNWTLWQMIFQNSVKNAGTLTFPDGSLALPLFAGKAYLTETWLEE